MIFDNLLAYLCEPFIEPFRVFFVEGIVALAQIVIEIIEHVDLVRDFSSDLYVLGEDIVQADLVPGQDTLEGKILPEGHPVDDIHCRPA